MIRRAATVRALRHFMFLTGICLVASVARAEGVTPLSDDAQWPLVWLDEDGDCQDSEVEALIREAVGLITWADPEACSISAGRWQSWGNGAVVGYRQAWVVPLVTPAQAVSRGGLLWNRDQQIALVNDLDNLIVMDPHSARERGYKDLTQWQPAKAFRCDYAHRWRLVSERHALQLLDTDRAFLSQLSAGCPSQLAPDQPGPSRIRPSE